MRRGFYKILIILMSLALIGLIVIQVYWLKEALKSSREQFDGLVYQAMYSSVKKINQIELNEIRKKMGFDDLINTVEKSNTEVVATTFRSDSVSSQYVYVSRFEKKQIKVPISEQYSDSLTLADLYKQERKIRFIKDSSMLDEVGDLNIDTENAFRNSSYSLERLARIDAGNRPVKKRLNMILLDSVFRQELSYRGLNAQPQMGVLSKDSVVLVLATENFVNHQKNLMVPLYTNEDDSPTYYLASYFPERTVSILGPIIPITALTILFTIIIITVFSMAIYYMRLQRKISEVKTDFINNMTHELKTPLATINIATDALKNKKIIENTEKIKYYSNLIKQENKRMNNQVEMVLRMSRLERNEIDINPERTNLNELIAQTVEPIRLIVEEERNGIVFEKYDAKNYNVSIDSFHFGNIILNILENANKYSPEAPQIEVRTYNQENSFILSIKDKGMGMSRTILKKIFEQFYRAETGNVHNVKGQGLGLAYVKKIVEMHNGLVWAESEKNIGSTFYIKMPVETIEK